MFNEILLASFFLSNAIAYSVWTLNCFLKIDGSTPSILFRTPHSIPCEVQAIIETTTINIKVLRNSPNQEM